MESESNKTSEKDGSGEQAHPPWAPRTPEDFDRIVEAVRQKPDDPAALLEYCRGLAELLRQYSPPDMTSQNGPGRIPFGSRKMFSSLTHVVNTIYDTAGKISSIEPISMKFNLAIATLATSTVPNWCRVASLSKICLERALLFHADSAKAVLRMGFFCLSTEKNPVLAKTYFDSAYNLNPEEFSAITAILYTSFQDLNKEHLDSVAFILKKELNAEHWSNAERATLFFIRGVFTFLFNTPSKIGIVNAWIKAFDLDDKELRVCFEKFEATKRLFRIPEDYNEWLNHLNFSNTLKTLVDEVAPGDKNKLKMIRNMIKAAGRKEVILKKKKEKERFKEEIATIESHRENSKSSVPKKPPSLANSWFWNWKSELYGGNLILSSLLGGTDHKSFLEACEILRVGQFTPKPLIFDAYRKLCLSMHPDKECADKEEFAKSVEQMSRFNWAFATVCREFERRGSDQKQAQGKHGFKDL